MKLFYKLLIISVIPLICLSGLSYIHSDRMLNQIETNIEERMHYCAQDVKFHLNNVYSRLQSLTTIIAQDSDIQNAVAHKKIKMMYQKSKAFMHFGVSGMLLMDASFQVLCQIGHLPVMSKPGHAFFKQACNVPQTAMVDIQHKLYILSSHPLTGSSGCIGFVITGMPVYPNVFKEIINHLQINMTIKYDNRIVGTSNNRVGLDAWTHKTFPIQMNDIMFQVTIYENAQMPKLIIESRQKLLFLSLTILALFSLCIAGLVHRLIAPINDLINAMHQYSKGELRLSLLPDVKNEIGNLYQAFHRMIIDLEHAEQRFRRIFDNAIEGMFQTHPEGYFIRANPALAHIFGYLGPEDMMNAISDLASQMYVNAEDRNRFKEMMTKNNQIENFEAQMYKKDHTIIWVSINARNVRRKDGTIMYYEGFLVNIHERKMAETNNQERKALEMANQTKSEFLANISHEIRTPLNAVLGLGKLLKKTSLSDMQKEYLTDMLNSSQTLLDLINDILNYSRLELDKITLNTMPFFLLDIYQSIISMFKHQVQRKKMAMVCHISPECGIELMGDPIRVKQILVNLVGNAVKFTNNGQIWIQTESLHEISDKIYISISVTDTGIGIRESDQKRIFQAFTQTETSANRKYTGAGLGLAICEKLVQVMDGKLFVTSMPSKGSTFSITLPFAVSGSQKGHKIPGTYSRVLIIEDDPINARFAQSILKDADLTVDVIEDGHQALSYIQENAYDMVFMDIQLPEIDGYELTQTIRKHGYATLPIIALTACVMKGDREKCLSAGMNDYLPKPFEPDDILQMYQKWKASVKPMDTHEV